jgi:hypothetical protein
MCARLSNNATIYEAAVLHHGQSILLCDGIDLLGNESSKGAGLSALIHRQVISPPNPLGARAPLLG